MSRQTVETLDYIAFARRVIRAAGERCAEADDFELAELITLRDDIEAAITRAVVGLRNQGHAWQYIGDALGIKRQSAQERYAKACAA
ncbi:hypothetical protein [Microbacterium sp. JAI119]|uniref:hypothetical protein n=1 Tax=Microbacterium sp. JAI119 TaxID=2723062 RepID=UPI0015C84C5A|nr:hypothetical protein [Microbacterium sp. JAI119]NYF29225.1 hypothetical protein [Microbacterium sp. JAI119]